MRSTWRSTPLRSGDWDDDTDDTEGGGHTHVHAGGVRCRDRRVAHRLRRDPPDAGADGCRAGRRCWPDGVRAADRGGPVGVRVPAAGAGEAEAAPTEAEDGVHDGRPLTVERLVLRAHPAVL